MTISLLKDIEAIHFITTSLNDPSKNLSDESLNIVIANLGKCLKTLNIHLKQGLSPITPWKTQILESLHDLNESLSQIENVRQIGSIKELQKKILKTQATAEIAPNFDIQKQYNNIVPIAFFCDIDCIDDYAISICLERAIVEAQFPLITTTSLLQGKWYISGPENQLLTMKELCLKHQKSWDIFQKDGLLVFIPKAFHSDKQGPEKLPFLDLDEKLCLKSVDEIFFPSQKKVAFLDFINLFCKKPKVNKLFFLLGHGGPNTIGSLNKDNYLEKRKFLKEQNCKGFVVWSCSSGGISCLQNIPDSETSSNFLNQQQPSPYFTIVCSVGDFTISGSITFDINKICKFAEGPQTISQLQKTIYGSLSVNENTNKDVKIDKNDEAYNILQFYPTHSPEIPHGFRPLKGFNLTTNVVNQANINIKANRFENVLEPKIMTPLQAEFLLISTLVVEPKILFTKHNCLPISMIHGTGHHYLKSLELAPGTTIWDFLRSMLFFHHKKLTYGFKGFFISEIGLKETKIRNVVFKVSTDEAKCAWLENEIYYMTFIDAEGCFQKKQINGLEYAIFCYETVQATAGLEKAVRAATAGRETESTFQAAFEQARFYPEDFYTYFDPNQVKTKDRKFKETLVLFYLKYGSQELALKLFRDYDLEYNLDIKDWNEKSLMSCAIEVGDVDFVQELCRTGYSKRIDVTGRTPIHQVLRQLTKLYKNHQPEATTSILKYEKIFEILLKERMIHTENIYGWPPIASAFPHRHLVMKLVENGASLNIINSKNGRTLLDLFIMSSDSESIDLLLELGVIPDPKALTEAIRANNFKLLKRLLDAGGKPFERDCQGNVPFLEAILHSPIDIFQLLLTRDDCNVNIEAKNHLTPLMAAYIVGNEEKLKMLVKKKAIIPINASRDFLKPTIRMYTLTKDIQAFEKLFNCIPQVELKEFIAKYLAEIKEFQMLDSLIHVGYINDSHMKIKEAPQTNSKCLITWD